MFLKYSFKGIVIAMAMMLSQSVYANNHHIACFAVVTVEGMVCDFCAQGIAKKMNQDVAIDSFRIDLNNKKVVVAYTICDKEGHVNMLNQMIKDSGYSVREIIYESYNQKRYDDLTNNVI